MEEPDYFDEIPQIGISDSQEAALTNEDSDYEEKRKRKFFDKQKADWNIKVKGKKARKEDLKKDSGIIYDAQIVNNDSTTQLWRRMQNEPPEKVRAAQETLELFKKPEKGGRTRKLRRVKRRKLRQTKKVRQTKNARKTKRIRK
jgi:hypothetical protein